MVLRWLTLDELRVEDEESFSHVALFDELKQRLRRDGYRFRAPERGRDLSWDRALFANLTFWQAGDQGDVLVADRVPADVVVHVGWHHVARAALGEAASSADGMFLGEAIASASDLYLVGRLLGHAPDSEFLATQVPAMGEAAEAAGLDPDAFEKMLLEVSAEPERAFEDLRALLFDAGTALVRCASVDDAFEALGALDGRRFAPLLHHYELSNWILAARAQAPLRLAPDPAVRAVDRILRAEPDPVSWLTRHWIDRKT
jgi:hypothetical protein